MGILIESLTARERECLRLVARDRSTGEIARLLSISINTVDNHIKNAKRKLGTSDRFTAARLLADHEGRSQSLASLRTVMERETPISQSNDAEAGSADVVRESPSHEGLFVQPMSLDGWPRLEEPAEEHYRSPALKIVAAIVLIMAGILIIIVALPALANSAQVLADFLKPRIH
jgi:DNA-binding CsgD family transcriptional regulator